MAGITWTSRTSATDNNWWGVTYGNVNGNGLFVAVASSGTGNRVMTSPDGITWTSRTSAADNNWFSVIYGNGLFVAVAAFVGTQRVMTSQDGINWTLRNAANNTLNWTKITYSNDIFVSVAAFSGSVMTSGQHTCVLGSTKILMKDGSLKEIKDIIRGDEVIEDIKTNKTNIVSRVISMKVENKNIIKIPKNLLNNSADLFISEDHPIWINNDEQRLFSKNIEGVEKYLLKDDMLYNIQYDTEGTYYANGIKIDSLSPYHQYYNLPKELYIDTHKYVEGIIIYNENDKRRNKPKLIKK